MLNKLKKNKTIMILIIIIIIIIIIIKYVSSDESEYKNNSNYTEVKVFGDKNLHTIKLSKKAFERLGIKIFEIGEDEIESDKSIEEEDGDGWEDEEGEGENEYNESTVIPYSSIIYDNNGKVWVYVEVKNLVYLRRSVEINYIEENKVFLSKRISVGIKVVMVGVSELFGVESGTGGGH